MNIVDIKKELYKIENELNSTECHEFQFVKQARK